MARPVDSVKMTGEGISGHSPALNPLLGGQQGIYPRIGMLKDNKFYAEFLNAGIYITQPVIPILLEAPSGFRFLPNEKEMISIAKAIMEVHPKSIDGLDSTLSVDTEESEMGRGRNKFTTFSRVSKAETTLTFTWDEKMGRPITKFFNFIITTLMQDPETGYPKITKYFNKQFDSSVYGGVYTSDNYTFTMLFIEPNICHDEVEKAWLCTNMLPKGSGEVKGSRNLTEAGGKLEISIEFPCITMDHDNVGVLALAKAMLKQIHTLTEISDLDMTIPTASRTPTLESEELAHSIEKVQGGNGEFATFDPYPAATK